MSFKEVVDAVSASLQKNAPVILTGIGITGCAAAVVLGIVATPRALEIIKKKEEEKGDKLTKKEVVQACWKNYIPTAVAFVGGAGCVIGGQVISTNRAKAFEHFLWISQTAALEYQAAVKEAIGEEKERLITEKFQKDYDEKHLSKTEVSPITGSPIIVSSMSDSILCYDEYSDREFISSLQELENIDIWVRKRLSDTNEQTVSLHDYYMQFSDNNFRPRENDEDLGWNCRDHFSLKHNMADINKRGIPRIVVTFREKPHANYSDWS